MRFLQNVQYIICISTIVLFLQILTFTDAGMQNFASANPRHQFAHPLTVAVDALVRPVAGDARVELAVADVALEAVLVVDLPLAEHLQTPTEEEEECFL